MPERTRICNVDLLERLRAGRSVRKFAGDLGISAETALAALTGEGLYPSTIRKLAARLRLTYDELVVTQSTDNSRELAGRPRTHSEMFRFDVSVCGFISHQREEAFAGVTAALLDQLRARGITVSRCASQIVLTDRCDSFQRKITFLRSRRVADAEDSPLFVIAVRPSRFESFLGAVSADVLDLGDCAEYGELINFPENRSALDILTGTGHPLPSAHAYQPFYVVCLGSDIPYMSYHSWDGISPQPPLRELLHNGFQLSLDVTAELLDSFLRAGRLIHDQYLLNPRIYDLLGAKRLDRRPDADYYSANNMIWQIDHDSGYQYTRSRATFWKDRVNSAEQRGGGDTSKGQ